MNTNEAIETLRTLGLTGEIRAYEKGKSVFFYTYQGHIASIKNDKLIVHNQFITKNAIVNKEILETN